MEVYEAGPAAAANLRAGDIILEINGEPVYSQHQALLISASTAPGDSVDVLGIRDNVRFRTTITAGERPQGLYDRSSAVAADRLQTFARSLLHEVLGSTLYYY